MQNILLSEEEPISLPHTQEIPREPDILREKIEALVVEIRGEWLTWSVGK